MIKILDSKNKNFDITLDKLLSKRKNKVQLNSVSVTKIIKDVKKNGDKAVLKYEKKFNKNSIIIPSPKKITKTIKFFRSQRLKKQSILLIIEFINSTRYKNLKTFLIRIN